MRGDEGAEVLAEDLEAIGAESFPAVARKSPRKHAYLTHKVFQWLVEHMSDFILKPLRHHRKLVYQVRILRRPALDYDFPTTPTSMRVLIWEVVLEICIMLY